MTLDFLTAILSVPNPSGHEELLVECIENWCGVSGVEIRKDGHGNLFLKKGGAKFYPCYTAHLDSVHGEQEPYVKARMLMTPKVEGDKITMWIKNDKGEDVQTGTGSDCKNGVAIALAALSRLPAAKAVLYSGEEKGCVGSRASDFSFYDDCAFVVGLDSPGRNRAAKSCMGLELFSQKFFDEYLGPISAKHGLTDFRHEPGTDIMFVRQRAGVDPENPAARIETVNFGNGGYDLHTSKEWASYKDTCEAEDLAVALGEGISLDRQWTSVPGRRQPPPPPPGVFAPPRTTSAKQAEFDFDGRPASEHDGEEECRGLFEFTDRERFEAFEKELDRKDLPVQVHYLDGADTALMFGQLKYVKAAFVCAFNAEEGTSYKNWKEFADAEGTDEFDYAVKFPQKSIWQNPPDPVGRKNSENAHSDADTCEFTWLFRTRKQAEEFAAGIKEKNIEVALETDDEMVVFSGTLKWVKLAYVWAYDVENGKRYTRWSEFDKAEPTNDFWDNVEFKDVAEFDDAIDVEPVEDTTWPEAASEISGDDRAADRAAFDSWLGI